MLFFYDKTPQLLLMPLLFSTKNVQSADLGPCYNMIISRLGAFSHRDFLYDSSPGFLWVIIKDN
jgi:hypothetical protein